MDELVSLLPPKCLHIHVTLLPSIQECEKAVVPTREVRAASITHHHHAITCFKTLNIIPFNYINQVLCTIFLYMVYLLLKTLFCTSSSCDISPQTTVSSGHIHLLWCGILHGLHWGNLLQCGPLQLEGKFLLENKIPTNSAVVQDFLVQLNVLKFMGPDGIHPLNCWLMLLLGPLCIIFQWPWEYEEFLVNWKLGNVPVFKKGKKEDSSNYRPISLTSVLGKIMEKVILGINEKHLKDSAVMVNTSTQGRVLLNKINLPL